MNSDNKFSFEGLELEPLEDDSTNSNSAQNKTPEKDLRCGNERRQQPDRREEIRFQDDRRSKEDRRKDSDHWGSAN